MSEIKLRDYQREAIDSVFDAWGKGTRRPAIVLPTGSGKTVVFAALVRQWQHSEKVIEPWAARRVGLRVIVLVHRDELADQAISKLRQTLPADVSVGKVKAQNNDIDADVMVCSVQTLASARRREQLVSMQSKSMPGRVGLIITDECHHAAAASYRKVYDAFPDALNLGVTATLERGDGVGLGSVWDEVVYSKSILWMISRGYLTDVQAKQVKVTDMAMDQVKVSRGDYQAGDLGQAMLDSGALDAISRAYVEHAKDRPGVVFTPTVETAEEAARGLNAAGVRTAVISGETPREERLKVFDDFRKGHVQVLSNCMVLTEGFDAPWAEVAVIARPTRSRPLYTQMVGRVLRPWPGKKDALVLDLVGASSMGLRTLVDLEPGAVHKIGEGESLADAAVREAEEGNQKLPAGSVAFELKVREVGMFAGSEHAWHRTQGGVMFMDIGKNKRVFLRPSPGAPGSWDIWGQNGSNVGRSGTHQGLDLSMAMAWGEVVADEHAEFSIRRSALWRKGKPSEAQIATAERAGIEVGQMNKGELSEALSVAFASRSLDRFVSQG